MSVQVESEDQEEMVVHTPSKRRTRAMRIVDDDDDSAGEEEEAEEEEEEAEGVRLPLLAARVVSDCSPLHSQRRTNWSPTRSRNLRFLPRQR